LSSKLHNRLSIQGGIVNETIESVIQFKNQGGTSLFAKNLTKPILLLQVEALERRLSASHECMPEIKKKIIILKSGYNGEKELNYQLGQIPYHKYQIFHDIRLPIGDSFFQMDALLLSPKILINLENKNHAGKITIEKNQMIQEAFDKREIFENPISQANRHKILLKDWIGDNNYQPIKMDHLVVFSRSSSEIIIPSGYKDAEHKICKTHNLLEKIEEIEAYFNKDWLSEHEVLKLRSLLLKSHTPNRGDILKMFNIPESDIIPGVQCPQCLFSPMIYDRINGFVLLVNVFQKTLI
jgi:hypothetical protein